MLEIKVRIKNDSKSCTYKDLIYDSDLIELLQKVTQPIIDQSVESFGDDPEKVSFTILKVIQ